MESYCSPLQLQGNCSPFLFDCDALLEKSYDPIASDPASDPGYFSAGSCSLSPTSSVDSFCFSPTSLPVTGLEQDALDCFIFSSPETLCAKYEAKNQLSSGSSKASSSNICNTTKKSRSRYPGKKRQTASEREKLRMRDLTKALHHLRMYLPPSVAPAGQTLTKIETLRLTIRYISYLSAQLGLSEEVLEQRRSAGFVEQPQTLSQILGQPSASFSPQEPGYSAMETVGQDCRPQISSLQHSYQVSGGICFSSQQYWTPQQQLQHAAFSGQC
ncbi:mesoderm posterior aa [Myripristis murdjan]|uniref:mesoderm posterior aa n=1 Tax=Myripristis murdjan TaxID=586833 RepID=UPI001175FEF3|nr:mesoderm posterior protein 1-like [Myripristis murdjan]